jgi:hypothetical protein
MSELKLKTYTILSINCDCASGLHALHNPRFVFGPRCPFCYKNLGPMEYRELGKVKAEYEEDAIRKYKALRQTAKTKEVER